MHKPGFNGTFKGELEEKYAMWVEENIMGRNRGGAGPGRGGVPQPSHKEVANWVLHALRPLRMMPSLKHAALHTYQVG